MPPAEHYDKPTLFANDDLAFKWISIGGTTLLSFLTLSAASALLITEHFYAKSSHEPGVLFAFISTLGLPTIGMIWLGYMLTLAFCMRQDSSDKPLKIALLMLIFSTCYMLLVLITSMWIWIGFLTNPTLTGA